VTLGSVFSSALYQGSDTQRKGRIRKVQGKQFS